MNVPQNLHYESHDAGLLIAFTTLPLDNPMRFINDDIGKLFQTYRQGIMEIASDGTVKMENRAPRSKEEQLFQKTFFQPASYICFGKFDAVHFAVVDDLEFATRVFRPYNPIAADANCTQEKFDFQVIFGSSGGAKGSPTIVQKATNTFLRTQKRFPYVAICQLKVNNSLLLGPGAKLILHIQELIRQVIDSCDDDPNFYSTDHQGNKSTCDFLLTESFSYQELVLSLFGNSYAQLSKLILKIRELKFSDLIQNGESGFGIITEPKFADIEQETLAFQQWSSDSKGNRGQGIRSNHLFNTTVMTFGYDLHSQVRKEIDLDETKQKAQIASSFLESIDHDISLRTAWYVKPGHLNDLIRELQKAGEGFKTAEGASMDSPRYELTVGKGDLTYPLDAHGKAPSLAEGLKFVEATFSNPDIIKHILEAVSTPSILMDPKFLNLLGEVETDQHFQIIPDLKRLEVDSVTISKAKNQLKAIGMPSVLTEKITTILSSFNNAIQDRLLYSSFLELHNFVKHVLLGTIENYWLHRDRPDFRKHHAENVIFALTEVFEIGYRNRLMHTYWSSDRTEFNLDYRGGIQVILAAWDVAYKALSKPLGELDHANSFVFVSGFSGVVSLENALKLNYSHIFLPSIYLSVAGHEAANHYLNKLITRQNLTVNSEAAFSTRNLCKFFSMAGIKPNTFGFDLPKFDPDTSLVYNSSREFFLKGKLEDWKTPFLIHLKADFYRYLIVDTITFYYCFHGDAQLFWHYSWGYLLQLASAYTKPSTLDKHLVLLMMMRLVFVLKRFSPDFLKQRKKAPSSILEAYWKAYYANCLEFADELINGDAPELRDWMDYFQGLAAQVIFETFPKGKGWQMSPELLRLTEEDKISLTETNDDVKKLSKKFTESIRKGTPPDIRRKDRLTIAGLGATRYTSTLIYAYLKLIHDDLIHPEADKGNTMTDNESSLGTMGKLDHAEIVLHRTPEGTVWLDKDKSAPLLLDPFGGYFTHNLEVRRRFFKYRTTMIKSLWSLAMLEKGRTILKLMKELDGNN